MQRLHKDARVPSIEMRINFKVIYRRLTSDENLESPLSLAILKLLETVRITKITYFTFKAVKYREVVAFLILDTCFNLDGLAGTRGQHF